MSNKLQVNVIVTTYDTGSNERYKLLFQTLEGLVKNLVYPNLRYVISDDTRSVEHHQQMIDATQLILEDRPVTYFHTAGRGVGHGKNTSLMYAFKTSPITLLTEDDWLLTEPLDLLPHVQLLLDHDDLAMVRMGFLGGDMTAKRVDYGSWDAAYWWLQPQSGFYVYSGQTSLRHSRFYTAVGWHDENCTPGQEEESMCWRYNKTENPPKILWPCVWGTTFNAGPFKNIGVGTSVNNVIPVGV